VWCDVVSVVDSDACRSDVDYEGTADGTLRGNTTVRGGGGVDAMEIPKILYLLALYILSLLKSAPTQNGSDVQS